MLLRRYLPHLVVLAAAVAGVGYWVWSEPVDPTRGREIVAVATSNSGRWFAAASGLGWVGIWDREHLDMPQRIRADQGPINDLAFSPDEQFLAVANANLTLYPVSSMGTARVLRKDKRNYGTVRFNADGTILLSITGSGSIETYDSATGQPRLAMCCSDLAGEVSFTPEGHRIVSAGHWPSVWNASTGKLIGRLAGEHELETLRPIRFDARQNLILMGSQDGKVYGWDLDTYQLRLTSPAQPGYVDNMTRLRGTEWIALARTGQEVRLWNPDTNQTKPLAQAVATSNLAPGPEPNSLLFGNYAGSVEFWNIESGSVLQRVTLR